MNINARKLDSCVSIQKAAEILNVSTGILRRWDELGTLKAYRNPKNNYRLYHIGDLEKFARIKTLRRHSTRILID